MSSRSGYRFRCAVVGYTREALTEVAAQVVDLAEAEDLPAHGAAVRARLED